MHLAKSSEFFLMKPKNMVLPLNNEEDIKACGEYAKLEPVNTP